MHTLVAFNKTTSYSLLARSKKPVEVYCNQFLFNSNPPSSATKRGSCREVRYPLTTVVLSLLLPNVSRVMGSISTDYTFEWHSCHKKPDFGKLTLILKFWGRDRADINRNGTRITSFCVMPLLRSWQTRVLCLSSSNAFWKFSCPLFNTGG
jgi:hypothetical protein